MRNALVVLLVGLGLILIPGWSDAQLSGGGGDRVAGSFQKGSEGDCKGDPPCNKECPDESEFCHGWDGECGCDKDKRSDCASSGVIATFATSVVDGEVVAILDGNVIVPVRHSLAWGGTRQSIMVPIHAARVNAREAGDGEWLIEFAHATIPGFPSLAVGGQVIGPTTMTLCEHGKSAGKSRLLVSSDGEVAGWIALDITPPTIGDVPVWYGTGYTALELRGRLLTDGTLVVDRRSRVRASSSHP
jgi:hypothetical protein